MGVATGLSRGRGIASVVNVSETAEPSAIYLDIFLHSGSDAEIESLQQIAEARAINQIDGWSTIAAGLLLRFDRKRSGSDE